MPGAYEDHPFGPESVIIKVEGRIFAQIFNAARCGFRHAEL